MPISIERNFEQKIYFRLLEMRSFFLKKGNPIFSIKLKQRLPKSFSQLHVKNSRFFLSFFLKKDDWPKAYADPRLPTLPYDQLQQVNKTAYTLLKKFCFKNLNNMNLKNSQYPVTDKHRQFTIWYILTNQVVNLINEFHIFTYT